MVFGLFARKSATDASGSTRLPTPTPPAAQQLSPILGGSSTTESVAEGHAPPPTTPSPPPVAGPNETKILHDLMLTIPPKTLHAYILTRLRPEPPDEILQPPSPTTVIKLATFFSTLTPPPLRHCMRCHKDFYDIENEENDKGCRVPHDDESTLVSRISGGGGYETLWGCCGQTAPGDGSEGPPDGWCYEGRHTTDIKRARFRADSNMHDDKLTSCLKLNCHGIRDRLPHGGALASPIRNVASSSARRSNPSPARSQASVRMHMSARKRPRRSLKETTTSENEADEESVTSPGAKAMVGAGAGDCSNMAVDERTPSRKPRVKMRSQPLTRPLSMFPTLQPVSASTPAKTKSRTLLSQTHTHLASDSEASVRSGPRTRSHVREESRARDASRCRTASTLTRADPSGRVVRARRALKPQAGSLTSGEEPEVETDAYREGGKEERGRGRKKRRVSRG